MRRGAYASSHGFLRYYPMTTYILMTLIILHSKLNFTTSPQGYDLQYRVFLLYLCGSLYFLIYSNLFFRRLILKNFFCKTYTVNIKELMDSKCKKEINLNKGHIYTLFESSFPRDSKGIANGNVKYVNPCSTNCFRTIMLIFDGINCFPRKALNFGFNRFD